LQRRVRQALDQFVERRFVAQNLLGGSAGEAGLRLDLLRRKSAPGQVARGEALLHTRVTTSDRIAGASVGLLALAFIWAHPVGQKRREKKPPKTKNHGWPERSLFPLWAGPVTVDYARPEPEERAVPTMPALTRRPPKSFFV
jgi:hypothetical protein